jgi:uncharacterized NAD(P)/FAD-binding protein YdhS
VHRHRVAPTIGARVASQIQEGKIEVHAGRVKTYIEDNDGVAVTFQARESEQIERLRVDRVINCTGPESDCRRADDPLLTDLMRQKLARPDPLFLGLDVSGEGGLIDANGDVSDLLYAIGPIRKGSLWETIAVPDLRVQVYELSRLLVTICQGEQAKRREGSLPSRIQPSAVTNVSGGFDAWGKSGLPSASKKLLAVQD